VYHLLPQSTRPNQECFGVIGVAGAPSYSTRSSRIASFENGTARNPCRICRHKFLDYLERRTISERAWFANVVRFLGDRRDARRKRGDRHRGGDVFATTNQLVPRSQSAFFPPSPHGATERNARAPAVFVAAGAFGG
jgi:hypothetical protein